MAAQTRGILVAVSVAAHPFQAPVEVVNLLSKVSTVFVLWEGKTMVVQDCLPTISLALVD